MFLKPDHHKVMSWRNVLGTVLRDTPSLRLPPAPPTQKYPRLSVGWLGTTPRPISPRKLYYPRSLGITEGVTRASFGAQVNISHIAFKRRWFPCSKTTIYQWPHFFVGAATASHLNFTVPHSAQCPVTYHIFFYRLSAPPSTLTALLWTQRDIAGIPKSPGEWMKSSKAHLTIWHF